MVKIFPPRNRFKRCAETAMAGFAVVDAEHRGYYIPPLSTGYNDEYEDNDDLPFEPYTHFVDDAAVRHDHHVRHLENIEMEKLMRIYEASNGKHIQTPADCYELMRMYDQVIATSVANRRHM